MKHLFRKCLKCDRYTLKDRCPLCSSETVNPHPAKFTLDDKYLRYRISERYSMSENQK